MKLLSFTQNDLFSGFSCCLGDLDINQPSVLELSFETFLEINKSCCKFVRAAVLTT